MKDQLNESPKRNFYNATTKRRYVQNSIYITLHTGIN